MTPVEAFHSSKLAAERDRRRSLQLILSPVRQRVGALVLLAIAVFVFVAMVRPLHSLRLDAARVPGVFPGRITGLAWPAGGEAAVAVQGVGMMASRNSGRPVPIASVTKMMTAYIVLRDHPLRPGDGGPLITVTPADVAAYRFDSGLGGSVTPVADGERITELQALEALLVPSADNMATLLATWDAGTEGAFVAKMNTEARTFGLTHTHYADPAGLESATVSTAAEQVRLALLALRVPALTQIVGMSQVSLPIAGVQRNYDQLLGTDGIFGVKTGSTPAAGGCFVFAADRVLAGRRVTVVGAVLGQPIFSLGSTMLDPTFDATTAFLGSVTHKLETITFARSGTLARLNTTWGGTVAVRPAADTTLVGWPGLPVRVRIHWKPGLTPPVNAGETVGAADLAAGQQRLRVRLVAARAVQTASVGWRLTHP